MYISRRFYGWLVAVGLVAALMASPAFRAQLSHVASMINPDGWVFWCVWVSLQGLCAVFMVPSLPLVIFAAARFPEHPGLVLVMTLLGVALSATLIFRNVKWLQLNATMQSHPYAERAMSQLRRHGGLGLAVWCAAPILPSDLGCYIAASSGMRFRRYFLGVLAGEAVLCSSIIFGVQALMPVF